MPQNPKDFKRPESIKIVEPEKTSERKSKPFLRLTHGDTEVQDCGTPAQEVTALPLGVTASPQEELRGPTPTTALLGKALGRRGWSQNKVLFVTALLSAGVEAKNAVPLCSLQKREHRHFHFEKTQHDADWTRC